MNKDSVTIVCLYNNPDEFTRFKSELKKQTLSCKIIGLNNINNSFSSSALAYNYATKQIDTEFVIYSHQDIVLTNNHILEDFINYLSYFNKYDLVGVAGAYNNSKIGQTIVGNIKNADGSFACMEQINNYKEVQTLDECLFGGYTECFKKYPFNEELCDGFHLYAVDRSLSALVRGSKVYVVPIDLIHKSPGKVNKSYRKGYFKVCKYYKNYINEIHTTIAFGRTYSPYKYIDYFKRSIERNILASLRRINNK